MKTISRYIMTLALLITAATGAWAQSSLNVVEFAVPAGWEGDVTSLTAADFPGFKDYSTLTDDEAKAIPNPDPSYNQAIILVYGFDGIETKYIVWDEEDIRVIKMSVARDAFYEETAAYRKIYYTYADPNDIEVTTNAAEEGATFTEASFQMPAFDATADYELVRDMSIQMTAQVGDGTQEQPRYRVKKDGNNKFIPADMEMAAVPALFTVNDAIEQKALTQTQDYIVQIYAIDAEGQPTGDPMTFDNFTFEPGIYAVKAVAVDGSDYDGETALSNTFKLFQGYEITVPGGEYITYYSATENLKIENDDAQLYTITAVDGTKATAAEIASANKEMPFLVYNKLEQEQEIVLIPTEDQINQAVYSGFKGTADGQQISSTATTDSYVMTGKQFVWLKDAGLIAAQRCWLEVPKTSAQSAPVIYIQTDGMSTGVKEVKEVTEVNDNSFYDLNGRKLQGKPQQKGVYILNGKKIVVR